MPKKGRPISSAILKYGLVNFAFIVIEEVDTDLHNIEIRETYWIKHIKPSPRYLAPYRKILFFLSQKTKKCFAPAPSGNGTGGEEKPKARGQDVTKKKCITNTRPIRRRVV